MYIYTGRILLILCMVRRQVFRFPTGRRARGEPQVRTFETITGPRGETQQIEIKPDISRLQQIQEAQAKLQVVETERLQVQQRDQRQRILSAREAAEAEQKRLGRLTAATTLEFLRSQASREGKVSPDVLRELGRIDPSALRVPMDKELTFTRFREKIIGTKVVPFTTPQGRISAANPRELAIANRQTNRLARRVKELRNKEIRTGLSVREELELDRSRATIVAIVAGKTFATALKETAILPVTAVKGLKNLKNFKFATAKQKVGGLKRTLEEPPTVRIGAGLRAGDPELTGQIAGNIAAFFVVAKLPLGRIAKTAKPTTILKAAKFSPKVIKSLKQGRIARTIGREPTFRKTVRVVNRGKQRFGIAVDRRGDLVILVGRGAKTKAATIKRQTARAILQTSDDIPKLNVAQLARLRNRIGVAQTKTGDVVVFVGKGSGVKASRLNKAVAQAERLAIQRAGEVARTAARVAARKKRLAPKALAKARRQAQLLKAREEARISRVFRQRQRARTRRLAVARAKIRVKRKVKPLAERVKKIRRKIRRKKRPLTAKQIRDLKEAARRKRVQEGERIRRIVRRREAKRPKAERQRRKLRRQRLDEEQAVSNRFKRRIAKVEDQLRKKQEGRIRTEADRIEDALRSQRKQLGISRPLTSQERIRAARASQEQFRFAERQFNQIFRAAIRRSKAERAQIQTTQKQVGQALRNQKRQLGIKSTLTSAEKKRITRFSEKNFDKSQRALFSQFNRHHPYFRNHT